LGRREGQGWKKEGKEKGGNRTEGKGERRNGGEER